MFPSLWLLFIKIVTAQIASALLFKHPGWDSDDVAYAACDMGFLDILLSFLFFLNESGPPALFISAGANINKRIDSCRSPTEKGT